MITETAHSHTSAIWFFNLLWNKFSKCYLTNKKVQFLYPTSSVQECPILFNDNTLAAQDYSDDEKTLRVCARVPGM